MRRRPGDARTAAVGQVMTVEQVADYLQLNRLTVYRYIREGKIPAARIGKLYRVLKADVDRFLEARKVGGNRAFSRGEAAGAVKAVPPRPAPAWPRDPQEIRQIYVGPTWKERLIDRSQAARVRSGYPLDWVMRGLN